MVWQFNAWGYIFIFVSLALVIIGELTYRRRYVLGHRLCAAFIFTVAGWCGLYAAELAFVPVEIKFTLARLQIIASSLAIPFYFLFLDRYLDRDDWLSWRLVVLFFVVPAITITVVIFAPDFLMFAPVVSEQNGLSILTFSYGPWFPVYAIYQYLLLLISTIFMVQVTRKAVVLRQSERYLMVGLSMLPWLASMLYFADVQHWVAINLTPLTLALVGFFTAWILFNFQLHDERPHAYRQAFRQIPEGLISIDMQGRIHEANNAANVILRRPQDMIIDFTLEEVMPVTWWRALKRNLIGSFALVEVERTEQDGLHFFELRLQPVMDVQQRQTGSLLILEDITERRRAEIALRRERMLLAERVKERTSALEIANQELVQAAQMKDSFMASMSHELRTPLMGILGRAEALRHGVYGPLGEKQDRALDRIEESGRHLLELISEVLDLSKMEAGQLVLEVGQVNVTALCQSSLRLVTHAAHKKDIDIAFELAGDVHIISADERRLKQILVNLLTNAVKFTPAGGEVGLCVTGSMAAGYVAFEVWDTGIGISAEMQHRLFEPFVQVDNRLAREHEGTGLGLAIVRRLTDMHDGDVVVESVEGQGSRFTVKIPVAATQSVGPHSE